MSNKAKVIYILSMGHSGSTLLDCILGTIPLFCSTGELRYLGWQLQRTKEKKPTVFDQDICSCENDFRNCILWSKIFQSITIKTGEDIVKSPHSFPLSFFGQFKYNQKVSFHDKFCAGISRRMMQFGHASIFEKSVSDVIRNNFLLYDITSQISGAKYIVDSSKNYMNAMFLQRNRPKDVIILMLNRNIEGLVNSYKKMGRPIEEVIKEKKRQDRRFDYMIKNIKDLRYYKVNYDFIASNPGTFLSEFLIFLGEKNTFSIQSDDDFFINPQKLHLVAGNPMRYRGKQKVSLDENWRSTLSENDLKLLQKLKTGIF